MNRQIARSLTVPFKGALDGLTVTELEILHNRLRSKNFHPFAGDGPSLFADKDVVSAMIPKHLKIQENKFNKSMQAQAKHIERMRTERASRYIPALPRLPDEVDLNDCNATLPDQQSKHKRALRLRGLRISSEMEKKLLNLFASEAFKKQLDVPYDWRITTIKCNLELTKAFIFFVLNGHEAIEFEELSLRMEQCKLALDSRLKAIRYFISKTVYLKRVPELEFTYDKEMLALDSCNKAVTSS